MFGLSFGASKEKTNALQTTDMTTTGTQNTAGTQNQTTNSTSNTSSSGTSSTSANTDQTQNTTGKQSTTGVTQNFDPKTLEALGGNIGDFISKILGGSTANPDAAASALGTFDPEKFINDTMAAATASTADQVGQATRGVTSLTGGNAAENSMTALLDQHIKDQAGASLAGVRATAEQTAQGIQANRAQALSGIGTSSENALSQVLNAIKGGTQTTTQDATNVASTGTTGTNTSTTNTAENSTTQQSQQLIDIINQLVNSNQNVSGTVKTDGTTSKMSGGFSLGL